MLVSCAANEFLDDLVSLLSSRRAEEHKPLLTWIVQVHTYIHRPSAKHSPSPKTRKYCHENLFSPSVHQRLKKHREKSTGRSSPPSATSGIQSEGADGGAGVEAKGMAATLAQDKALAERKEMARRQREKAMAQMQNMQRKFLEQNREHMLDLETSGVDEVYVHPSLSPLSPLSPLSFFPPLSSLFLPPLSSLSSISLSSLSLLSSFHPCSILSSYPSLFL